MTRFYRLLSILSALTAIVFGCVVMYQHSTIDQLEGDLRDEHSTAFHRRLMLDSCRESVRMIPVGTYQADNGDAIVVKPLECCGDEENPWNIAKFHYGPTHRKIRYLNRLEVQLLYAMPGWPPNEAAYYDQFKAPPPRMIGG